MSKPEPMTMLNISIIKNQIENFMDEILSIKYIHLIPPEQMKEDKVHKIKHTEIISESDLRELQANLLFIADNLKINLREVLPEKKPIEFSANSLSQLAKNLLTRTQELKEKLLEYKKNLQEKSEKIKTLNISMEFFKFLEEYSINLSELDSLSLFRFIGFYGSKTDINNLFITLSGINGLDKLIFQTKSIVINNFDYLLVFCFVDKEMMLSLKNAIEEGNCKIINLDSKYVRSSHLDSKILQNDIDNEKEEIDSLLIEIQALKKEKTPELAAILEISENIELVIKLEHKFYISKKNNVVNVDAYIPTRLENEIINRLTRKFGSNIRITVKRIERELIQEEGEEGEGEEKQGDKNEIVLKESKELNKNFQSKDSRIIPPTLITHNRFVRPFKLLVDLYGMPNYAEVDPTIFVAITFPLFFGMMFGDVGHGLVLIMLGFFLILSRKTDNTIKDFGRIVVYCGLGSILGGLMYGEFFGNELFLNGHPFFLLAKPMERFTFLLKFVTLLGVIHLSIGWLIKFFNYWTNHKKYLAVADPLLKILGLVGGTYLIFTYMFNISTWLTPQPGLFGLMYMPFLYPAVPGILLVFSKFFGKIFKVPYLKKESAGSLLGEGVIETGETYLGILSNVASYSRLLALALAHIGFMVVVEQMALMIPGIFRYFMLFFGNLFVIMIEAILAGIQALRLHLYEFFGKFYLADGYQFETIELHNRYSKIILVPLEKSSGEKE